jgi:hypothetical protein
MVMSDLITNEKVSKKWQELFDEGRTIFGNEGPHAVVQNYNPNLCQADLEQSFQLICNVVDRKEAEFRQFRNAAYEWWTKLKEAFVNHQL